MLRQNPKYRRLRLPLFPLLYFVGAYIFKGSFRDGVAGLRFRKAKAFYHVQLKIRETESRNRRSNFTH